jgi:hypothetical protein
LSLALSPVLYISSPRLHLSELKEKKMQLYHAPKKIQNGKRNPFGPRNSLSLVYLWQSISLLSRLVPILLEPRGYIGRY